MLAARICRERNRGPSERKARGMPGPATLNYKIVELGWNEIAWDSGSGYSGGQGRRKLMYGRESERQTLNSVPVHPSHRD